MARRHGTTAWQSGRVLRSYHGGSFAAGRLAALKQEAATGISVCIPARNEAATVGRVAGAVRAELMERYRLVDELVVVDDGSTDSTARVAREAGAVVVAQRAAGKGRAMRSGLDQTRGDIVVYLDADIEGFDPGFVVGLVGPLLSDPDLVFVKASYRRPLADRPGEGGRVTELAAKPLLRILFPQLAAFDQPLAGEVAGRRAPLEKLDFEPGYGVEVAMLVDLASSYGLAALGQCDLGERRHRNRPLAELSPQSETVIRTILARAGWPPPH
jgi:glucosyl-3-phosphoglycerate synthase